MTKQDILIPLIAVGLVGAGLYFYFKKKKEKEEEEPPEEPNGNGEPEPPSEKPSPDERYPIVIVKPTSPGQTWSRILPNNIAAEVTNPYGSTRKLHIGMSMQEDKTGLWTDYPIKSVRIRSKVTAKIYWWIPGLSTNVGLYHIVSSVWDVVPSGNCEAIGTCHRLGTAESNIKFWYI